MPIPHPFALATALLSLLLAGPIARSVAAAPQDPADVIRQFLRAAQAGDEAAFRRLSLPAADVSLIFTPRSPGQEELQEIAERSQSAQVYQTEEFAWQGRPLAEGESPERDGTTARYVAAAGGGPTAVTVVRSGGEWKVDLRWWIEMAKMARSEGPPPENSPELVIKNLVASMLRLDRQKALSFVAPGADPEALFLGAPGQPEPSGHQLALAFEMPLVEVGPEEFYRMPSGRVVQGSRDPDRKLLVGMFGPTAVPFMIRRVDGQWRVEGEPYFLLLDR